MGKCIEQANREVPAQIVPRLVSVKEAAGILGVSVWTLRQWLSQRRIAVVKVGRLTKLQLHDLQAFIAGNRREARPF
jgi:excisionase family DNA binding protein